MWKSRSLFNSSWPHGLYSPWNSPGQTTGVGSRSLLQGTFPVQGWNPGLPHLSWILHQLSHQGSPITPKKFNYTVQLYQRNSHTVKKVLGPTADFPTWGIWWRDWDSPGNLTLEASGIWLQNFYRTGKQTFRGHKRNLVPTRTQEKGAVTPLETEPDLPVSVQEAPASGQATGKEHSLAHQQRIGLKIYWAWPQPSEQDSDSPSVSLSHQEASISFLFLPIRGQTERKPQSQKTNQTDHMDHSLV